MSKEMGSRPLSQSRFRQNSPHSPKESRERLLQLAQKTHRYDSRPNSCNSPELRPKMGLRAKDRCRNSAYVSEQSLPDKLSHALKLFRPGNLVHSASSSAPFKLKNRGAVAADDVVYISAPEPRAKNASKEKEVAKRRHHSVLMNPESGNHVENRDTTLKDLDQIRNLYRSVPNVSTLEDNDFHFRSSRQSKYADDFEAEASSSTRSPTDSGYRSTPRHNEENPYMFDDEVEYGISHKTTTVVHVNGNSTPPPLEDPVLRVHGANLAAFEESLKSYGILNELNTSPINERDIVAVLQVGRCKNVANLLDISIVPKLVEMVYSVLVTLTEHISRLTVQTFKITKDDVIIAAKLSFPVEIYTSCQKAGSQALSIFALSGTGGLRKGLSERSNLSFSVGKLNRWLLEKITDKPITDTASVTLTAVLECILEELVLKIFSPERDSVLSLQEFNDAMHNDFNLVAYFARLDQFVGDNVSSTVSFVQLMDVVDRIRQRILHIEETVSLFSNRHNQLTFCPKAAQALYYFITNSEKYKDEKAPLAEWTKLCYAFAEYRLASMVEVGDVQQAARLLLKADCPPVVVEFWKNDFANICSPEEATRIFAFSLIATGLSDNIRQGIHLLEDKLNATNIFGLTALSEAVVRGDEDIVKVLISSGCPVNVGVPKSKTEECPFLLSDYTGWSPLMWAVSSQNMALVDFLLGSSADLQNDSMIRESPLQVAVQSGNRRIIGRLLECGADPFRSTFDYSQEGGPHCGCPSALATAAARGDTLTVDLFLETINQAKRVTSVDDFLKNAYNNNYHTSNNYQNLPPHVKIALQEAIYYAAEHSRPEIAHKIKNKVLGLNWNLFTWTRALQGAAETKQKWLIDDLISDFSPKLAAELSEDNINYCLSVLFSLVKWECRKSGGSPIGVSFAISRLWHYFGCEKSKPDILPKPDISPRPVVDPSFVNNEHLSDVRFRVDGEIVYGHRIVLFNASDKFKALLQSPKGVVDITDISRKQFLAMMEYLYTGKLPPLDCVQLQSLSSVAIIYGLSSLKKETEKLLHKLITPDHIGDIYQFAIVHTNDRLLEECEKCVLENFDAVVKQPKMRELLLSNSGEYDVCTALSSRLLVAFDLARSKQSDPVSI